MSLPPTRRLLREARALLGNVPGPMSRSPVSVQRPCGARVGRLDRLLGWQLAVVASRRWKSFTSLLRRMADVTNHSTAPTTPAAISPPPIK
jgi:hypothetical protein